MDKFTKKLMIRSLTLGAVLFISFFDKAYPKGKGAEEGVYFLILIYVLEVFMESIVDGLEEAFNKKTSPKEGLDDSV